MQLNYIINNPLIFNSSTKRIISALIKLIIIFKKKDIRLSELNMDNSKIMICRMLINKYNKKIIKCHIINGIK